jgi:hypothetical protein
MMLDVSLLAVLWGTAAARVPTLWRDGRQRALWSSILLLALVKTVVLPPVAATLRAPILPHLLGVAAAFFLLRFIMLVAGARHRRWPLALAAGVLLTLGVLAAVSGGIQTRAELLTRELAPTVVAYWVVLEAYLGAVLVTTTVLFWTVSREAPPGRSRLGLRAIAAGAALVAAYAAAKAGLIVARGAGVPVDFPAIEPAGRNLQAAGFLLIVAGGTVPAGRRARSVCAAYRSLLALRPLWKAMRDAFPEVILFTPRRAVIELAGVDDVHLRLYRRVIEIRDGMLALRPYLPAGPPAAGDVAAADPAAAEAAAIAVALRRRVDGAPADGPEGTEGSEGAWQPVGPEVTDEVAWLSRVSRQFRRVRPGPAAAPTPRPSGSAR